MNKPINRITIVGGGTTGYLTTFRLAKAYPTKSITWIYPENNDPIGVGEAIVPAISHMLKHFGVTHKDIIRECNGTIKLGGYFVGWNTPDESFSFPFGYETPNPRHNSASVDRIIETGKAPADLLEYSDIATHFRATELLKYLDRIVHKFKNVKIERRTVTKEELKDTYDLLIDSTGFKRALTQWPDNFLSIQDKIPNNQAYIYRTAYTDREKQCMPYTVAWAMDYGWIFNIPLKNEIACGYVHPNKFDVMDEFVEYLKKKFNVDNIDVSKIRKVPMITGRNHVHLKDKVVAMGLASTFIEPLESTGLLLVLDALDYLLKYINGTISEKEYNMSINAEFDSLVDFIIGHYKYSKRSNEYWDHYKNVPIKRQPLSNFPNSGWDNILSGFLPEVSKPKELLDPKELISIHRGKKYYEWIQDQSNFKNNVTVGVSGYNGFLASKLRDRLDIDWVDRTTDIDCYLHLGSPTFTDEELTKENAQTMHRYVKETIELIDSLKVPIIFASTTGVDDIQLDHKGSTCYNLAKLYIENYIINNCEKYMILRIGTITSTSLKEIHQMKPNRIQQRIMQGNYKGIPLEDKYLNVEDFVNTTANSIRNFKNGIVTYNLKKIKLSELMPKGTYYDQG